MGKITDALKKAEQLKQIEQQAWDDMQKSKQTVQKPPLDTIKQDNPKQQTDEKLRKSQPRRLTLEDKAKIMQEKLNSKVYIAKSTDNSGIDARVVSYYTPNAHISEQYRILRTNILSKAQGRPVKVFLISSSLSGEGKTVTAVNLAISLAHDLDKKIVLVDCDLRGGNIHQMLNINFKPGLSDILANGTASEAALQNNKINNLTVLTCGEVPNNPSELLGSRRMRRLVEELKSRFDYIILDSPPIIHFTDASILGAQSDGVMMVVQAEKTQERIVRSAQEVLRQAQAKLIGFIFTQTDYSPPGYYSYYYNYHKKGDKVGS
ncbi:CpsD/CapB family tyrosine-protein kinase [Candidatus Omnitrophota bacterium]